MEGDDENSNQGGGDAASVRIFLQSRCTFGVALRCRDEGGYSPHETGPGGFPVPGEAATDGAATATEAIREVGVHLSRGDESGCRV